MISIHTGEKLKNVGEVKVAGLISESVEYSAYANHPKNQFEASVEGAAASVN